MLESFAISAVTSDGLCHVTGVCAVLGETLPGQQETKIGLLHDDVGGFLFLFFFLFFLFFLSSECE